MVTHASLVQFFVPGCKNLEISGSALWSQVCGYNWTVLMQVWRPKSLTGESQPKNRRPMSQPKQLKRGSTLLLPSCALQAHRELQGVHLLQGELSTWPRVMVPTLISSGNASTEPSRNNVEPEMIGYHTLKTNEQDSYAPQELTGAGFVDLSSNRKALKMTCYVLRTGKDEPQLVKLNRPVLKSFEPIPRRQIY